jgi:hypothetical protein
MGWIGGRRSQLVCKRDFRAAVSAIAQLGEHLVIGTSAPSIEVHAWAKGGSFVKIAHHHAQTHVVSLRVLKHFVLYADM